MKKSYDLNNYECSLSKSSFIEEKNLYTVSSEESSELSSLSRKCRAYGAGLFEGKLGDTMEFTLDLGKADDGEVSEVK